MNQKDKIKALATDILKLVDVDGDSAKFMAMLNAHEPFCDFGNCQSFVYAGGGVRYNPWNPFERWDHAGMVVEKLKESGWSFRGEDGIRLGAFVSFTKRNQETGFIQASACGNSEKIPAAICEAALATQGD